MSITPWSDNKNARQVYRELVDRWGFVYDGDTSDGHHVFAYPPTGAQMTLAHSPSAGWAWVKARRAEAAKITGIQFRGKRDTHAAKERQAKISADTRRQRIHYIEDRNARELSWQAHQRINENRETIANIRKTLRDLTTVAQRRQAEAAIRALALENHNIERHLLAS